MSQPEVQISRDDTLPGVLAKRARASPERMFIEDVAGPSMSYGQFHARALAWAGVFRALGVGEGDRVAVFLPVAIDTAASWVGMSWLKALEVPINTNYVGDMLRYILGDCGAKVLLIADGYLDRLAGLDALLPQLESVIVVHARHTLPEFGKPLLRAEELLAGTSPAEGLEPPKPWNLAGLLYTGGTTGPSKGVMVPWGFLHHFVDTVPYLGPDDAFYAPFPMFHGTGKVPLLAMATRGGRVVLREQFRTQDFWHDIETFRCTATVLLPTMSKWVLALEPSPDDRQHCLRNVIMVTDMERFRARFGTTIHTHFGATEVGAPLARHDIRDNFGSCGRVMPGYEVRIVDDLDYEVAHGEVGELIVRTSEPWTCNQGYYGKPEKTLEAWRNGWVHTGDAFRRDAEGNFYFVDRKRDYMRRRGENISSFEVEALVAQHPELAGVAAIGVPSEHGEDEVKIVCIRKEGSTLSAEDLIRFLIPRMPRYMVPRYVEFVTSLPRTAATQNVRKVELRQNPLNDNTWDREKSGIVVPR